MRRINVRLIALAGLMALLSACSYFRPMPRVRPGTDMALPAGAGESIVGAVADYALGCSGPDVGPVQVRERDAATCLSLKKDTVRATAPGVPVKKP